MQLQTIIDIPRAEFLIDACEQVLLVGSCFADGIGRRFREEAFPTIVNPYGTMYNPASILHTIERLINMQLSHRPLDALTSSQRALNSKLSTAFLTLGTNHVYRLKETGEIVDNCEKRPAALFQEEELSIDDCADYLGQTIDLLRLHNPDIKIILTVSPIRYRKYGYHESQLSKATLLLATKEVIRKFNVAYFPSYELMMDELRDYRFYAPDMLHPSEQAVDYIWQRMVDTYFSPEAKAYLDEWRPLKQTLAHRPFNPDSPEYKALMNRTRQQIEALQKKYPSLTT